MKVPPRSILVPTDFALDGDDALQTASRLLQPGGELHAVHVLEDFSGNQLGAYWGTIDDERRISLTREALLRATARAGVQAQLHVEMVLGNPANGIVDLADRLGVDLVVMPSHGRTGLARLTLGSVAERVVRLAPCPVLVLRASDDEPV